MRGREETRQLHQLIFSAIYHGILAGIIGSDFVYATKLNKHQRKRNLQETISLLLSPGKLGGHKHFTKALRQYAEQFNIVPPDEKRTMLVDMPTKTNLEADIL